MRGARWHAPNDAGARVVAYPRRCGEHLAVGRRRLSTAIAAYPRRCGEHRRTVPEPQRRLIWGLPPQVRGARDRPRPPTSGRYAVGLPPQVRGALELRDLRTAVGGNYQARAYPRRCGEHARPSSRHESRSVGLPPQVRGARALLRACHRGPIVTGLPPQVRGAHPSGQYCRCPLAGLTPAGAGSTASCSATTPSCPAWAYPRRCGEHAVMHSFRTTRRRGLPPQVRGAHVVDDFGTICT